MKVEISNQLADEIKNLISNSVSSQSVWNNAEIALSLLKKVNVAIQAEKQAYEDHIEDMIENIQM